MIKFRQKETILFLCCREGKKWRKNVEVYFYFLFEGQLWVRAVRLHRDEVKCSQNNEHSLQSHWRSVARISSTLSSTSDAFTHMAIARITTDSLLSAEFPWSYQSSVLGDCVPHLVWELILRLSFLILIMKMFWFIFLILNELFLPSILFPKTKKLWKLITHAYWLLTSAHTHPLFRNIDPKSNVLVWNCFLPILVTRRPFATDRAACSRTTKRLPSWWCDRTNGSSGWIYFLFLLSFF